MANVLGNLENTLMIVVIGGGLYIAYNLWQSTEGIRDTIDKNVIQPVEEGIQWANEQPGFIELANKAPGLLDKLGVTTEPVKQPFNWINDQPGFIQLVNDERTYHDILDNNLPPNTPISSYSSTDLKNLLNQINLKEQAKSLSNNFSWSQFADQVTTYYNESASPKNTSRVNYN